MPPVVHQVATGSGPRAAAGHVCINPGADLPLAGFASRLDKCQGVHDNLEANALVFQQEDGPVALVTVDLLYVGPQLRKQITDRLANTLDEPNLFIAASHTHFAPATNSYLPKLGETAPWYVELVADRIAGLLADLLHSTTEEVRTIYREGHANHSINRRRRRPPEKLGGWFKSRPIELAPNSYGKRDETLRLIELRSRTEQAPICFIWNYACHPTSFPLRDRISAEYPGVVRRAVRAEAGRDLPVLFLQGFSGNVRPRALASPDSLRGRLRGLRNRHFWHRFSADEWNRWSGDLAARVVHAYQTEPVFTVDDGPVQVECQDVELDSLTGSPFHRGREFRIQRLQVGTKLQLFGVSAEPMVEHLDMVRRCYPSLTTVPVGYIDDVFGYLPTTAMLPQEGYEVSGHLPFFSNQSPLPAEIEKRFIDGVRRLAHAHRTG